MKKRLISIFSVLMLFCAIGTYLWATTFDAVAEEKIIIDLTGKEVEEPAVNKNTTEEKDLVVITENATEENPSEENPSVSATENEPTASLSDMSTISSIYSYNEITMTAGSITIDDATLTSIKNNTSIDGLALKAGNGAIIMDTQYIASLLAQSQGNITFAFAVNGNTVTVSAKTNGNIIYGDKGLCIVSTICNGDLNTSVVDSNGVFIGTSCYFADAKVLRWQMAKSEKYTITNTKVSFGDTINHWGKEYVEFLASRGVVNGMFAGNFSPDSNITRGQFITILNRISKENGVAFTNNPFKDVINSEYYFNAVCWGTKAKIINGRTTTTFAPNATITREEMATMCYRYIEYLGVNIEAVRASADFSDISSVMPYAVTPVKKCHASGVINGMGDNKFVPSGNATRAESASMVASLISYLAAMPH